MDIIGDEELESVSAIIVQEKSIELETITKTHALLMASMDEPVNLQKELAATLKIHLDKKMAVELEDGGTLSETTRRWLQDYNNVLNTLHKNLHGDKHTNLNVNVVSHSNIASNIRKYRKK